MKNPTKILMDMKFLSLFSLAIVFNFFGFETYAQQNIDQKVDELLKKMSIEEKVGQMTQVTIDMILKDDKLDEIDEDKLRKTIVEKHAGSILNVKGHGYSMKTWHKLIIAIQDVATKETPNHIPILYGIDAIHGPTYLLGATLFPHNIGMAATRNDSLVKLAAKITAAETRASGIPWDFDPVLGLGRQPLWPRYEETFGEDVYLVTKMGVSAINGYQEDGLSSNTAVAACMKHYIGYSLPLSGKDRTPAYIPEYVLREYLLPPFKAAADAGVATAMINSGEVNGVPVHSSKYYLTDILRNELGFQGVAVSDWEDVIRLHTRQRVAATPKDAVRMAVEAGLDMSMVPLDYSFYDLLLQLVKEGTISEKRIDQSVRKILTLKYKLGLFNDPYPSKSAAKKLEPEKYDRAALAAAHESMTLLKNKDNVLPIPANNKVLVAGPAANNLPSLFSSWSYTWQGNDTTQFPASTMTIKEALEKELGTGNVICSARHGFSNPVNYDIDRLKKDAQNVDYIILCLGEKAYAESPGVIDNLDLEQNQVDLAKAAIATGKKVVLVLTEGRPRVISAIEPKIPGILMAYRPATMGAPAIADVLTGKYNPNGKLPFTYPAASGDIVLYDHKPTEDFREDQPNKYGTAGYRPMFPFGYGLSYTTFKYSNLAVDKSAFGPRDVLKITVTVTNSGSMTGKTAVELYSSDLYASITPNVKRLRRYTKIDLKPGQSKTISFSLKPEDLAFVNRDGKTVTEPGDFELSVGDEKVKVTYQDPNQSDK